MLCDKDEDGVMNSVKVLSSVVFRGVENSGWCSVPAIVNGGWDWTGVWDDLNEIITVDWVSVDGVLFVDGRDGDCKVGKCLASVEAEKVKNRKKVETKKYNKNVKKTLNNFNWETKKFLVRNN